MIYVVHTKDSIQHIDPDHSHIIISIYTPGTEPVEINRNSHCLGLLRLCFDDVDQAGMTNIPILLISGNPLRIEPVTLFDAAMADQVLAFWQTHRSASVAYIHCDAGRCRSPAIAAALQKIEYDDDENWFATKTPNMLVYRTLLQRAYNFI